MKVSEARHAMAGNGKKILRDKNSRAKLAYPLPFAGQWTKAFSRDGIAGNGKKALVTVVLAGWWLWGPLVGYWPVGATPPDGVGTVAWWGRLAWPLAHVNFWHLAANVFCLWCMRGRLHLFACYLIAVACSFLPGWGLWGIGATAGFSGVLFAVAGVKWGAWCRGCNTVAAWQTFARRVLPFVFVGAFVPGVNWCIHGWCLTGGFLAGFALMGKDGSDGKGWG